MYEFKEHVKQLTLTPATLPFQTKEALMQLRTTYLHSPADLKKTLASSKVIRVLT